MARPKRLVMATAAETSTPPDHLSKGQIICRVLKGTGNNLFIVEQASSKPLLVELPAQFRNKIWIRRGGYVVVDTNAFTERDNKLDGKIVNVIREERLWRKQSYWPTQFVKRNAYDEDSDEDESTIGKMPSSDEEEDT